MSSSASSIRALLSPAIEDYLKTIYKLQHSGNASTKAIADAMGYSAASVTNMLKKLGDLGLADYKSHRGVTLSPAGEKVALEVIRHHRLLELYLSEIMGYSWDQVHAEAEKLEHHISEQFEDKINEIIRDKSKAKKYLENSEVIKVIFVNKVEILRLNNEFLKHDYYTDVITFNLDEEFNLHQAISHLIELDAINAAHDVSDGGLFVTLVEMGFPRGLGFDIETDMDIRTDAFLFGEGQGRVVVTLPEDKRDAFSEYKKSCDTNIILLGHVTKGKMQIDLQAFGFIDEARDIYMNALGAKIES